MALTTVQNLMVGGGIPITQNLLTVSSSYSIPAGNGAMSVGPITIANAASITIATGSTWVIL
jgi:hypothetical protein